MISEAPKGAMDEFDEDELLGELDDAMGADVVKQLPSVPKSKVGDLVHTDSTEEVKERQTSEASRASNEAMA
jgi:hypothetical protein